MVENGWYESVSLSDYVGVVWRRKWIALLVTVMVTAAAFGFSERQQKLYSATSQLVNTSASTTTVAGKNSSGNTWSTSHAPLLATLAGAQWVIHHAGLGKITPTQLLNETTIVPDANVDAIDFTVTDPTPAVSQQLANAWADYSGSYSNKVDSTGLRATIAGLNQLIAQGEEQITTNLAGKNPALKGDTPLQISQANARVQSAITSYQGTLNKKTAQLSNPGLQLNSRSSQSANKTQPKTARNALIGLVLGLILGVILAFLQDLLDTRIRTVDEVGRRLRLPLLASIPSRPRALRDQPVVLMSAQGGAQMPTAEAFRILKLNLSSTLKRGMKVIMFTSASDDEGISTTIANLAVALARSGQHVVVVDGNMRRPALGGFFGLDDRTGVSDILSGHSQLSDALTIVDVSRDVPIDAGSNGSGGGAGLLEVLPAGPIPADAAELLDSRAMTELLRELRTRADVVLVDAPPMLPVTDAMVLGTKVDAVVVVARARLASRPQLVALARALDACAAPRLGFVFVGGAADDAQEYGGYVGASPAQPDSVPQPGQTRETELL